MKSAKKIVSFDAPVAAWNMADISHRQIQLAQTVYTNMVSKLDPRDLIKAVAESPSEGNLFVESLLGFCAEFAFNACIMFEKELENITEHPLKSGTIDTPAWGETDVD